MKNKGFTLAELLAVIVILGLIAVITIPAVTKTLGDTKSNLCEDQLKNIKEAARLYGSDHLLDLPSSDGGTVNITLKTLQDGGYIDKNLENPKNKEPISENLIIKITKQGKKYNYDVQDFCDSTNNTVTQVETFDYTGSSQTFTATCTGTYKIEVWGAQGGYGLLNGSQSKLGGKGAYTKGTIHLEGETSLLIYVGGKGEDALVGKTVSGGYNGGGSGEWDHNDDEAGGGGGGASDIRLVSGTWDNFESLKSRIMVAGGGGGGVDDAEGGFGGALTGGSTPHNAGGAQTTGYAFGRGANAISPENNNDVGGGGSGYYGGFAQYKYDSPGYKVAGGGGSSYVKGCTGCDTTYLNSQGDYVFSDIIMKAGNEAMPNPRGEGNITGNTGNGYAKITLISCNS